MTSEMTTRRNRVCRPALQVVVLLALGGCTKSCDAVHVFRTISHVLYDAKPSTADSYLAIESKRPGAGMSFRPNRELWKPFRLEARVGFFDAAHATLGASGEVGVAVLETGGLGNFYFVDIKRSGDGIVVEASTGAAPQTFAIPNSLAADVVIESSGGDVQLSAKKPGDAAYTPIASFAAPSSGPYQMSLDVSDLPKGSIAGFDNMRLTANGSPVSPTAAQTARETIYTAVDALAECMYALDGKAPDRTRAGDQCDLAVARLDAALALDLAPYKGVKKSLAAARKKAAALVAKVRGTKSVSSLRTSLIAIVKAIGLAANAVN